MEKTAYKLLKKLYRTDSMSVDEVNAFTSHTEKNRLNKYVTYLKLDKLIEEFSIGGEPDGAERLTPKTESESHYTAGTISSRNEKTFGPFGFLTRSQLPLRLQHLSDSLFLRFRGIGLDVIPTWVIFSAAHNKVSTVRSNLHNNMFASDAGQAFAFREVRCFYKCRPARFLLLL